MVPQLEEMGPDVGQWARVLLHNVQVLLGQLPHSRAAALEQGRVVQVPLWEGEGRKPGTLPGPSGHYLAKGLTSLENLF